MSAPILTLDEVARRIYKSRRWLREWLRDNPRDVLADRYMLRPVALGFHRATLPTHHRGNAMPLKLIRSRNSKTPNLYIRGAYLGVQWIKAAELTSDPSLNPS